MSDLPPIPPGFKLVDTAFTLPPQQGDTTLPPIPEGFTLKQEAPTNPRPEGGVQNIATGSPTADIPRFVGTAATNAVAGAAALPRTLAQGVDWLGRQAGYDVGADKALASIHHPADQRYSLFPDYQAARDVMFSGGPSGPLQTEYVPQSYIGRRGMEAATGAVGGLMGGPGAVIPSAAGSATAGAAAEAFPSHPLIASMLGFIPGARMGQMIQNTPQRLGAAMLNSAPSEPYAAFKRQGLPTELVGTSTAAPGATFAEKFAARMPGSEGTIAAARSRLLDAWQTRLSAVADTLGTAKTPQELGDSLQAAGRDWLQNFKSSTGDLWNQFRTMVPSDQPTKVTALKGVLDDVLGQFEGAPKTAQVLQPSMAGRLRSAVEADTAPPTAPTARTTGVLDANGQPVVVQPTVTELAAYKDALAKSGTLPWQAVQSMRSRLGEMIENPNTAPDMSQTAIRRLYGALTDDMKAGAADVSPDALSAFHRANAATAAGHDLLEKHLNGVLNAPTPEAAAQYAVGQERLGGSRVGALTFNLPGAAGDLGSYALRNAATYTESPTALATAMLGRKPAYSPEAQRVLFPNPSTQSDIADLATVGQRMQPFEKDLANSPTATHQTRGIGRIVTAVELAKEGHELAGTSGRIGGFAAGLLAPNIMGRVAQATALNPWLSALYGRSIPAEAQSPSMLARALLAPTLVPRLPAPQMPLGAIQAPATSANLPQ